MSTLYIEGLLQRILAELEHIARNYPLGPHGFCTKHPSIPLHGDPHQSLYCPACQDEQNRYEDANLPPPLPGVTYHPDATLTRICPVCMASWIGLPDSPCPNGCTLRTAKP